MAKIGFDSNAFFSFVALVVFAGLIFGGVFAVLNFSTLRSEADIAEVPLSMQLVNVTEFTVSIFWQTEEPTLGYISYGTTSELGKTKQDERDIETGEQVRYVNHLVSLTNLIPSTKYFYTIGVNSTNVDRQGFPYTFFTNAAVASIPANRPISTTVRAQGGSLATDYFVTATFENQNTNQISNTLGALTKDNGQLILPITDLRSQDGQGGFPLTDGVSYTVELTMYDTQGQIDTQTFTYTPPTPFPVIVFGSTAQELLLTPPQLIPRVEVTATNSGLLLPTLAATPTATATARPRVPITPTPVPTVKPQSKQLVL